MTQSVNTPIKAIIFDFDGTLVDTKQFYFGMLAQYLQVDQTQVISKADELVFSKLSPKERNVKWKIVKAFYQVSRALGFSHLRSLSALFFIRENHSKEFSSVKPTKDAIKTLVQLNSQGILLAIVSDSPRKKIEQFIDKYLKEIDIFPRDNILASGEFRRHKESGFEFFLRKFNLKNIPRSCAMIGDLGGDILAGKTAGMTTFGFSGGYSNQEILKKNQPDAIVRSLPDMERLINQSL